MVLLWRRSFCKSFVIKKNAIKETFANRCKSFAIKRIIELFSLSDQVFWLTPVSSSVYLVQGMYLAIWTSSIERGFPVVLCCAFDWVRAQRQFGKEIARRGGKWTPLLQPRQLSFHPVCPSGLPPKIIFDIFPERRRKVSRTLGIGLSLALTGSSAPTAASQGVLLGMSWREELSIYCSK